MPHPVSLRAARLVALAGCLGAGTALAQPAAPPVSVTQAWARATIGSATTGAAYLTLTAQAPDQLTGASTPVAAAAQLHSDGMEGGVMHMRPVEALPLAPGKPVTLAPGSYHMMLTGLAHPLHRGDSFPMTLRFAHAAAVTVTVRVEGPGAGGMSGM